MQFETIQTKDIEFDKIKPSDVSTHIYLIVLLVGSEEWIQESTSAKT